MFFSFLFAYSSLFRQGHTNQAYSQLLLGGFGNMKLFDFKPTYFDSDEEAAVYFEHTVRQFLPKVCKINRDRDRDRDKDIEQFTR